MAMLIVAMLYNLAILAGCTYLVFWKDASPWWFLLAILCMANIKGSTA